MVARGRELLKFSPWTSRLIFLLKSKVVMIWMIFSGRSWRFITGRCTLTFSKTGNAASCRGKLYIDIKLHIWPFKCCVVIGYFRTNRARMYLQFKHLLLILPALFASTWSIFSTGELEGRLDSQLRAWWVQWAPWTVALVGDADERAVISAVIIRVIRVNERLRPAAILAISTHLCKYVMYIMYIMYMYINNPIRITGKKVQQMSYNILYNVCNATKNSKHMNCFNELHHVNGWQASMLGRKKKKLSVVCL